MKRAILFAAALAVLPAAAQAETDLSFNAYTTTLTDSDNDSTALFGVKADIGVGDFYTVGLGFETSGAHDNIESTQTYNLSVERSLTDTYAAGVYLRQTNRDRIIADDSYTSYGIFTNFDTGAAAVDLNVGLSIRSRKKTEDEYMDYGAGATLPVGFGSVGFGIKGLLDLSSDSENFTMLHANTSVPLGSSGASFVATIAHETTGRLKDDLTYYFGLNYGTSGSVRTPLVNDFNN